MTFGRKRLPLTACTVEHELPGRLRLRSKALRYLEEERDDLNARLEEIDGVSAARLTPITEGILVSFEPTRVSRDEVIEATQHVLSTYSVNVYKEHSAEKNRLPVSERRIQSEPIQELVSRVVVAGASVLYAILRPKPLAATFWGRLTSFNAITAISLAIPILKNGMQSLVSARRPNADTLSSTAIVASLLAGKSLSALTVILLADLAELLTAYSMERTRKAIHDMLSIGEAEVWRKRGDVTERVKLEELRPGDQIIVHTGEKISVDGEVASGRVLVDESPITGEFLPVQKGAGDHVFAGTLVTSGECTVQAARVGDETAAGRIIHLVEEASHRKADIQTFADKLSAQFIPVNFALALIVFLVTKSADRALNMLIIDYSCGVRLSTATAIASSIAASARQGVLIKGGNYIEMLSDIDTLVLDKTGTVTEGKPVVTSIYPLDGGSDSRPLLELAAAAEERSTHPMAYAIVNTVKRNGFRIPKHGEIETVLGRGVETSVDGSRVRVGNRRFMVERGVDVGGAGELFGRMARRGEQVLFVAKDETLAGLIGVQDNLKDNMKKALNRLRNSGFDDIILLTGDLEQQAEVVAERIRADRFEAEVLPENKSEAILKLQSRGIQVIMVGDGINDAPALAYADVGVAMGGTRTDIAMEAADITITHDDPLLIPGVIGMAKHTMGIVKQNFAAAIGVNSVGLILSTLGYLPVFWGAVLHNMTTVAVVMNSARLLFYDLERKL
jgi:cation-transporting P-type ATPase C